MRLVVDENVPQAGAAFSPLGEVCRMPGRTLTRENLLHADALIVRSVTRVDRHLLEGTPVRFVGTATIGIDHIDRQYLADSNIGFASAAGSNARSVVEFIIAALLEIALEKNLPLAGRTLGIIGHGNIGSRLARLAPALGLNILVNDPPLERAGHPGPFATLHHLLAHSDFLTLHVPKVTEGPDRTIGLIDAPQLAAMKSTAWLLNTSRGDVVVGKALHQALRKKTIAGAVLDVWENEPAIDRQLMDAVFLATPHIAGYSLEGKTNGTTMMHDALVAHFGIQHQWQPDMPPPDNPLIQVDDNDPAGDLAIIARAVRRSCPIREDDARLREGPELDNTQCRLHFDRLRREYPIRREFPNYTVALPGQRRQIGNTLHKLGFRIERRP